MTIYHHLPVQGLSEETPLLINQHMGKGHQLSYQMSFRHCWLMLVELPTQQMSLIGVLTTAQFSYQRLPVNPPSRHLTQPPHRLRGRAHGRPSGDAQLRCGRDVGRGDVHGGFVAS